MSLALTNELSSKVFYLSYKLDKYLPINLTNYWFYLFTEIITNTYNFKHTNTTK